MNPKILKRITAVITSIVLVVTCYGCTFKELCAFAEEISTESINADELIKCGDLNSDGQINVFDVMRAKRDILNKNPQPSKIADINNDGAFSIQDAMILQDYVLLRDVSKYEKLSQNSESNELLNNYKYSVFSGSSMSLSGEEININHSIASNGKISGIEECNFQPHSSAFEYANILPMYMDSKIFTTYFDNPQTYEEFTYEKGDAVNYNIETPIISYGDISISKELTLDKTCMMAYNNINVDNGATNNGSTIIYSKYGDVSISGQTITACGIIYAPFGTVKLSGSTINVNGIIIAKHVILEATDRINVNEDKSLAKFIGVDSEELFIPYSDWDYIDKPEDSVFAEIVEEQIYNDPLSVDDAWLEDYYGEEIVSVYGEDNKQQLVEALYMGQKDNISNYHDIITFLDYCRKNGFLSAIRLKTKLSKTDSADNALSIYIGNYEISTEKSKISDDDIPKPGDPDFIGPVRPYGPYKWDFYIYADEDDDGKEDDKDPSSDKKPENKKYKITDLPAITFLIGCGATIKDAAGGLISSVGAGIAGTVSVLKNNVLDDIKKAKIKSIDQIDEVTAIVQSQLDKTLASIGDTELFKVTQRKLENGLSYELGELSLNITCTEKGWNFNTYLNGVEVDLAKIENVVDIGTLKDINSVSPAIYKEIATDIMTDNVPSNMLDILDCIRNDTDKYKVAYNKLKNIEKAYDSVQHFKERVESYNIAKYSVNDNNLSLVENLKKANVICDDYCHCAHHIVAKEEKEAEFARSILKKYEIDINSASNGVFLPGNKKDKDYSWTISEANHFGGHSKQYLETVNDKLEVVDEFIKNNGLSKEEGRKLICETLDGIRKTLLTGELKIQNTETI